LRRPASSAPCHRTVTICHLRPGLSVLKYIDRIDPWDLGWCHRVAATSRMSTMTSPLLSIDDSQQLPSVETTDLPTPSSGRISSSTTRTRTPSSSSLSSNLHTSDESILLSSQQQSQPQATAVTSPLHAPALSPLDAISINATNSSSRRTKQRSLIRPRRTSSFESSPSDDDNSADGLPLVLNPGGVSSPSLKRGASSPWFLVGVIAIWFLIGVLAIVTTKLLLTEWQCPPLLLTFQQLVLGSTLLRLILGWTKQIQPAPWEVGRGIDELKNNESLHEFVLSSLFNAMDFLASNTAFAASAASFVETVKASDPITTTAVALVWKVDRLKSRGELISLVLLVAGLLLSTWGNSQVTPNHDEEEASPQTTEPSSTALLDSVRSLAVVLTANICFAFRAMTQKLYKRSTRKNSSSPTAVSLNDPNMLCRMQQIGWLSLLVPVVVVYCPTIWDALFEPAIEDNLNYVKLSMVNAAAYSTYK